MKKNNKRNCLKVKGKIIFRNIMILAFLMFLVGIFTTNAYSKKKLTTKVITVEKGQTVWNIAKMVCRDNTKLNVQSVIGDIKEINNIADYTVYEGQSLKVPEY